MIGPSGFMVAPKQPERPKFGTAPIRCGRTRCKWRGFETLLSEKKNGAWTRKLCPLCGCDSYSFMTVGEIQAWERRMGPNKHSPTLASSAHQD